jgi:hypothetical protein
LYNSVEEKDFHIDLMLIMEDDKYHFVLVRDLNSLLRKPSHDHKKLICRNCLQCFRHDYTFKLHKQFCAARGLQKVTMPEEGQKIKFTQLDRTQPLAFRFYADFESLLPLYDDDCAEDMARKMKRKTLIKTRRLQKHEPCGYSWICVDFEGTVRKKSCYRQKVSTDKVAEHFLEEIVEYCEVLTAELDAYQQDASRNMVINQADLDLAVQLGDCCLCDKEIDIQRGETYHKHHSHLPPHNFIGKLKYMYF